MRYLIYVFCALYGISVYAKPISLWLKQAPLADTLQLLAMLDDKNMIIDDNVQGNVSLRLHNTSFTQTLNSLAKMHKLSISQEGDTYFIAKQTPSNTHPQHVVSAENGQDMQTKRIKLRYAKVNEILDVLNPKTGSLLSSQGKLSGDQRSNSLILQDTPSQLQRIANLIGELDQPSQQVLIEARIVTISDESMRELGVRWGLFQPTDTASAVTGKLGANGFSNIDNQLNVNFGNSFATAAGVTLQVAKINSHLLDLELTALERENNVNIIASPRLITTNKQSASIKQGTEIPYVINAKDSQNVEFREAVLGLEVTPQISHDEQILLDLTVSQNAPGKNIAYGENQLTTIDKQEIQTQVAAKNGETIVLGGVFHDTISDHQDKVPLLGDVPGIKHLFSRDNKRHAKRELVIFVTPHLVKNATQPNRTPPATKAFHYGF
ncbi:type IV pilus secretin PilQ [Spirabiliibacterium falconis]|uniref:type IV pilus secretin PilQ n=1 Tax=Spirabiliibacterium falconis TaxID=572023 RepID=UPI001AACFEEB|nr:type IV pilus secretin PilQ [Spirabiliibacterium falconis]MBE2894927.1 type IV pilus secretin PilQ [Spirabiliibacterium falconis]